MTDRPAGPRVVLVAAVADNGVIGRDGDLPWRIPEDLRHFKATTRGHVLLVGRRTFESIGRPLPDRTTVVLSRDPGWSADGVRVVRSVEEAIEVARERGVDLMVGGGTAVYEAAMPYATAQVLTEVHQSPAGDTRYPDFDRAAWREASRDTRDGFDLVRWERRSS
jgi:dihydrofolate reductase